MNTIWSNWGLRLLALSLAILSWFIISVEGREQTAETTVEIFVTYNPPEDFTILDAQDTVRVRLQGPASRIAALNPFQVSVVVELRQATAGLQEIALTAENVDAPDGLSVVSVDPNVLSFQLDRRVTALKPIDVQLVGEPAAGAVAQAPTVFPLQALVSGPESKVRLLRELKTTPISLDGHALDFQTQAIVISPDPLIRIVEPSAVRVDVRLDIPNAPLDPNNDSNP